VGNVVVEDINPLFGDKLLTLLAPFVVRSAYVAQISPECREIITCCRYTILSSQVTCPGGHRILINFTACSG